MPFGAKWFREVHLDEFVGWETAPTRGEITTVPSVKVGYFCQHTTENLDEEMPPLRLMEEAYPGKKGDKVVFGKVWVGIRVGVEED